MSEERPWTDHDGTDDPTFMPPPSEEWQKQHGWKNGKPPPGGNGKAPPVENTSSDPFFVPDDHAMPVVRPKLYRASDWHGLDEPEMRWIIENWVPRQQVTGLYAIGGSLKTWFLLQALMARAAGLPFLGFVLERGPSFGIFCEDTAGEIVRRMRKIAEFYELPLSAFTDFHWISLAGVEETELVTFDGLKVDKTRLLRWLDYSILRLGIGLAGLDTLPHMFGGDEIRRGHVARFIRILDAISIERDCAIMFTAQPSARGRKDGSLESGSTHWDAGVRSRLGWTDPTSADSEATANADPNRVIRRLERLKSNYAPAGERLDLIWRDKLGFFRAAVDAETAKLQQRGPGRDAACDTKFLDLLTKARKAGDYLHKFSNNPSRYAPKVFAARPDSKPFSEAELTRSMTRLFAAERLRLEPFGAPSRGKQRLVEIQP
jgi:RecA-family ATPase